MLRSNTSLRTERRLREWSHQRTEPWISFESSKRKFLALFSFHYLLMLLWHIERQIKPLETHNRAPARVYAIKKDQNLEIFDLKSGDDESDF